MIKIILVDDHKIVLDGLKALLNTANELEIIGEAQNGLILLHQLKTLEPDLILLDIGMPVMDGIEAATKVKKLYPDVKILILSTYADKAKIKKMLAIGVDGYILKDSDKKALLNAIKTVISSDKKYYDHRVTDVIMDSYQPKKTTTTASIPSLSKREIEIVKLIAEGNSTKDISQQLYLSPLTVNTHRKNIFSKLGINKAAQLVKYAIQEGLID